MVAHKGHCAFCFEGTSKLPKVFPAVNTLLFAISVSSQCILYRDVGGIPGSINAILCPFETKSTVRCVPLNIDWQR